MNREASGEREEEAREDKGEDDGRQGHVRDENKEIKRPNGAVAAELRVSMHRMVNDVRDEKERRSRERAKHATSVGREGAAAHGLVGENEKDGAGQVEQRIDCGKPGDPRRGRFDASVAVDHKDEQRKHRRADAENERDRFLVANLS